MNNNLDYQDSLDFRLLSTINKISDLLLKSFDTESIYDIMQKVLKTLGDMCKADRCFIWKNYLKNNSLHFMKQICEWVDEANGVTAVQDSEIIEYVPYEPVLYDLLSAGKPLNSIVRDLDEYNRSILEAQDIKSVLLVPIHIGEYFWGFMGLDNCKTEELWSSIEEKTLMLVGFMIAIVINKHAKD